MDWQTSGGGPFRIKHKPLDYSKAHPDKAFLSGGWLPLHDDNGGLEPGDTGKFMAIPWQTDYNSCSVHMPSINTGGTTFPGVGNPTTLFWSWPAQRPVAIYRAIDVVDGRLPQERKYSIRGTGTVPANLKQMSAFQDPNNAIVQWDQIGVVLQGTAIDGTYSPEQFLETGSQLDPPAVAIWPFNAVAPLPKPHSNDAN